MFRHLLVPVCALSLLAAAPADARQDVQRIQITQGPGEGPMFLGPNRQPKTGTGRIRGRVVSGETGAAVRRAQVRISGPDIGMQAALTDPNGRYEFKDLPAGRFNLTVSKSGFVTMQYGQNRPFEPGRPIELGDAQVLDKADVTLPRGSVLSGRVLDEFGEPVADANVSAMRMQFVNGRKRMMNVGRNSQTNDLGQFRLYGLPPGEYFISATLRSMDMMVDMMAPGGPSGSAPSSGYAPTYFPGTPSPADAQRVTVAVGQELGSVDIALQPVKLAKITGTALGSDGKPISGAMVMLMPSMRDAFFFMPGGTSRTSKDGQFTISNVVPGDYTLQVRSMGAMMADVGGGAVMFSMSTNGPGSPPPPPRQEAEFATVPVTVAGDDVTGLVVVTTHGGKAIGRLAFEGGAKPDGLTAIRVMAPSGDPEGGPVMALGGSAVKDNGTFELTGMAGTRMLRVANLPKGWYVKSVHANGADVTDTGIDFKGGEDVSGIEVDLTQQTTAIAGSVADGRGQPVKDFTVVIFPEDQQKWTLPLNRWISSARPDQDGRFKVNNLPAGTYYAIALEYVAQGDWSDPDWLERARSKATRFTLDEGATKALDLKLAPM
jgi:protocatechuate 3,4-dioxygenase beta subunit